MAEWIVVLAAGAGTFALRASAVVLFGRGAMPQPLLRAVRHIGPAAIGALIAVAVVHPPGGAPVAPRLLAVAVAGLVAWRTRSIIGTLVAGFGLLLLVG